LLETIDANGVATVNQYDQAGHIPAGVLDLTSTTVTRANNVVEAGPKCVVLTVMRRSRASPRCTTGGRNP
jgi:hypothetical protein